MTAYPLTDTRGGPPVRILSVDVEYGWDDGEAEHVARMPFAAFHERYEGPGAFPGVYPPDYLATLRQEWPS